MDKGRYIRVRQDGKQPDDPQAKRSRIRPRLAAIQKTKQQRLKALKANAGGKRG